MIIICFFCQITSLSAVSNILLTVPKSGTHFLQYIVSMIVNDLIYWAGSEVEREIHETITIHTSSGAYDYLDSRDLLEKKIVMLVRDPRDVVLSSIDYVNIHGVNTWVGLPHYETQDSWESLPFTDKIHWLIESFPLQPRGSCLEYFEGALQLLPNDQILIIKYEDLV